MGCPETKLVSPEINGQSTVPEMMTCLRSSFREEDFEEVERLLVGREEKMGRQLRFLKREFAEMKKQYESLEDKNLELEKKLKKCEVECEEVRQQLVILETDKHVAEDKVALRDHEWRGLTGRVSSLEEAVARLLRVPVETVRNGAPDLVQERTKAEVSSSAVGIAVPEGHTEAMNVENLQNGDLHNGNLQNGCLHNGNLQNGCLQNRAVNLVESENGDLDYKNLRKELGINFENGQTLDSFLDSHLQNSSITTGTQCPDSQKEGLFNAVNGCDNQMGVRKQLVTEADSSDLAAARCSEVIQAPGSPMLIEISDDDEENLPAKSAHVFNSCASDVNSTAVEDSDMYLMPQRKRSMTETNDSNSMVAKRKKEGNRQLLHDEKDSLARDSSVKLDCKSAGSEPFLTSAETHLGQVTKGGNVQNDSDNSSDSEDDTPLEAYMEKVLASDSGDSRDDTPREAYMEKVMVSDSSDSEDDTPLEAYMEKEMASDKKYKRKTWKFAADMLSDVEKDDELCMNAICALYRKRNPGEKSPMKSRVLADPGFSYSDAQSITELAKFLIDGDPECKLKKSVRDVQQKDADFLSKCKALSSHYYLKLFEIYQTGLDPFFHPNS